MTQLVRYSEACRAIAAAKRIDEVRAIRNHAEALRAAGRIAKNKQIEADGAEIRIRAERRLGELIDAQKNTIGLNQGAVKGKTGAKRVPALDQRPTLAQAGIDKKLSARAQKLAAVPEKKFESMIGKWRDRVSAEGERVTASLLRETDRADRDANIPAVEEPNGKYSIILADPPWRYEHSASESREIENQYPTMDLESICKLPIADIAASDCVLFLWTTSPKLDESMQVVRAWGFNYRTCAIWDKEVIGMGYYFRQQHELLLIATHGTPGVPSPSSRVSSVVRSRRAGHSEKPEIFYEIIEAMYPTASRIELFARAARDGWFRWGNQLAA